MILFQTLTRQENSEYYGIAFFFAAHSQQKRVLKGKADVDQTDIVYFFGLCVFVVCLGVIAVFAICALLAVPILLLDGVFRLIAKRRERRRVKKLAFHCACGRTHQAADVITSLPGSHVCSCGKSYRYYYHEYDRHGGICHNVPQALNESDSDAESECSECGGTGCSACALQDWATGAYFGTCSTSEDRRPLPETDVRMTLFDPRQHL